MAASAALTIIGALWLVETSATHVPLRRTPIVAVRHANETTSGSVQSFTGSIDIEVFDRERRRIDTIAVRPHQSAGTPMYGVHGLAWADVTCSDGQSVVATIGSSGYFSSMCTFSTDASSERVLRKYVFLDRIATVTVSISDDAGATSPQGACAVELHVADAAGRDVIHRAALCGSDINLDLVDGALYSVEVSSASARAQRTVVAAHGLRVVLRLVATISCWVDATSVPAGTTLVIEARATTSHTHRSFVVPEPGPGRSQGLYHLGSFPEGLLQVRIATTLGLILHDAPVVIAPHQPCLVRLSWPEATCTDPSARLRVYDHQGRPLRGFRVSSPSASDVTRRYGVGLVELWFQEAQAEYTLFVAHPEYQDACVSVKHGDEASTTLSPLVPSELLVRLSERFSSPASVAMYSEQWTSPPSRWLSPGETTRIAIQRGLWHLQVESHEMTGPLRLTISVSDDSSTIDIDPPGRLLAVAEPDDATYSLLVGDPGCRAIQPAPLATPIDLWPGTYAIELRAGDGHSVASTEAIITSGVTTRVTLTPGALSSDLPYPAGATRASYTLSADDRWHTVTCASEQELAEVFWRVPWLLFELEYPLGVLTITRTALCLNSRCRSLPATTDCTVRSAGAAPTSGWFFARPAAGLVWRHPLSLRTNGEIAAHSWAAAPSFLLLRDATGYAVAVGRSDAGFELAEPTTVRLLASARSVAGTVSIVPLQVADVALPERIARDFALARAHVPAVAPDTDMRVRAPVGSVLGLLHCGSVRATVVPGTTASVQR